MGALSEIEIFDRMEQSLKEAADLSDRLAVVNLKGPLYHQLREHLSLIEGCARQAAAWRADARWLRIGMIAHECHERAGGWLRGYKKDDGTRVSYNMTHKNKMFVMLAINLRVSLRLQKPIKPERQDEPDQSCQTCLGLNAAKAHR